MNKALFIEDCKNKKPDIIVQKHLIDGSSFFFREIQSGGEFDFKKDLAKSLGVHIRDIVIVGSGKLGFSVKPDVQFPSFYQFKKFDFDFEQNIENEKSDLDIAIISGSLFDKQLENIYEHTKNYTNPDFKGVKTKNFGFYILKGWLRPDLIPEDYSINSDIQMVREKYKIEFGREINIGIYKSWYFFEKYHENNIYNIQLNLIAK